MAFIINLVINLVCGVIVVIVHELPKSIAAHFLTHPFHRSKKYKWVPPIKYIDPIGLILFMVSSGASSMAIGWQKPYEYNPNKLIQKHKSLMPIMLTGQVASLAFMIAMLPLWDTAIMNHSNIFITYFLGRLVVFNFMLFFVNLLPVPPFDMGNIIYAYSPEGYFRLIQNKRYIHSAFILVVALNILEIFGATILNTIIHFFI